MSDFLKALDSGRVLLMDGAMGTELLRAGAHNEPPQHLQGDADKARAIHSAYLKAGAEVLVTNTFRLTPPPALFDTFQAAVRLAKSTSATAFVLADLGPEYTPSNTSASALLSACADADGLLLETVSDASLIEACAADGSKLPRLLSFAFRRDSDRQLRTFSSLTPANCAEAAVRFGCAALGVNCGREIGLQELLEILARYRSVTALPLFVRPNAGTPTRIDGHWVYPETPESMATWLPPLFEAGVRMVGGCCGTTPAHIAAFRKVVDAWNASHP